MLKASGAASVQNLTFTLPEDYVEGSLRISAAAYPYPVGRLTEAIESLIREPCGCFEQTSSTTYPLVMVLRYLNTHTGSDPAVVDRAKDMLAKGYKKLVSYESAGGGFEWFGGSPGHEALTAYGVLQFASMASPEVGMPDLVDRGMLARTKDWLLSRRDGKGGFLRNDKSLDSFGAAPPTTTNAYITWALTRAGVLLRGNPMMQAELEALRKEAEGSKDAYVVALAALSFFDVAKDTAANRAIAMQYAERLASMQNRDGAVEGAEDTIARSQGDARLIETTALAVMAWLHDDDAFATNTRASIEWLSTQCRDGRFASTQATALTLQAIVEYDMKYSKSLPPGLVRLSVDGTVVEGLRYGSSSSSWTSSGGETPSNEDHTCEEGTGKVWDECASQCEPTCEDPNPPCVLMCVAKCACPAEVPIWHNGQCIAQADCDSSSNEDVVAAQGEERGKQPKKPACKNGKVWKDCGSKCTRTCASPNPPCVKMCVPKCECPQEKPYWHGSTCVSDEVCRGGFYGGARDSEGELEDGYDEDDDDDEEEEVPSAAASSAGATAAASESDGGALKFCSEKARGGLKGSRGPLAGSKHVLALQLDTDKAASVSIPFSLHVSYHVVQPRSAKNCSVKLETSLHTDDARGGDMREGDVATLTVRLSNVHPKGEAVPMTVAVIGIPAGLEPRMDKLRELRQEGRMAFYETNPGSVTLYWRALGPGQRVEIPIEVLATVRGTYAGAASKAYLYYADEFKTWAPGVSVTVSGRASGKDEGVLELGSD